ncbi:carboxypeptidase regulatory-like domain-containing protein [Paenibacillus sp. GSMTC-2017]|uniref:carboxypeptidase-like regulatory domain-containing protein n=1 Tax=Paenibacillus sp. GSMTC-2017 TaxID=2794350 RepID=UPI0018D730B2|nr:carboxypeptidase-like regulatory domain-containing protein [Paenibacillus sp. GSMTC-2017]MBH5320661.1 carboxypeptidase regulatory-like domain-containing protein [Paenibacillus sp. GSMTC-2017]
MLNGKGGIIIRIKVGVLAIILTLFAIVGWIGYKSLPSVLYQGGHYGALLKWFPDDHKVVLAVMQRAQEVIPAEIGWGDNSIFIMSSGSVSAPGGTIVSKEKRAAARSQLESLINEYPMIPYVNSLRLDAAKLNMSGQEWDKAQELLKAIEQSPHEFIQRSELLAYSKILESRHVDPEVTPSITGNVKIGDKPAANVYVMLQRSNETGWHSPPYGHYPITITDIKGNYQFSGIEPGEYDIGVGVQPEQIDGYYLTENEIKTVSTSHERTGVFNFKFVPQVRTTYPINYETIESDELRFEWNPYEGADYYHLSLISSITTKDGDNQSTISTTTTISEDKYRNTKAIYSLKELRSRNFKDPKNIDRKGNVTFWPKNILGPVYPGGHFVWLVDAYDANGRKLSSSAAYLHGPVNMRPMFSLPEEDALKGDRFVIEHNYDEAIEAYKQEGDNEYALRALARLASHGIKSEDEGNPAEALFYLEQIKEPNQHDKSFKLELEERH